MTLEQYEGLLERRHVAGDRRIDVFEWLLNGRQMFIERVRGVRGIIPRTPAQRHHLATRPLTEVYWVGLYTDRNLAEVDATRWGGVVETDPYSDSHYFIMIKDDLDKAIGLSFQLLQREQQSP